MSGEAFGPKKLTIHLRERERERERRSVNLILQDANQQIKSKTPNGTKKLAKSARSQVVREP
jgi:hypothetical protein